MQPHNTTNAVPYGYCHCGCGQKTRIPNVSNTSSGQLKGVPLKYINHHHNRHWTLAAAFWCYVAPGDHESCWEWQGPLSDRGYGKIHFRERTYAAHRVSFELHNGAMAEGLFACHSCDNPKCVNPSHLFAGTPLENVADMVGKGRNNSGARASRGVRLTVDDVVRIRELYAEGMRQKDLVEMYGVSRATIYDVVNRRWWRHVE